MEQSKINLKISQGLRKYNKRKGNKHWTELKSWPHKRDAIFKERDRKCEKCRWSEINPFNGQIPVQVDHINGNNKDHRPENLSILCPNCHSLTEHFMFYGRHHRKEK